MSVAVEVSWKGNVFVLEIESPNEPIMSIKLQLFSILLGEVDSPDQIQLYGPDGNTPLTVETATLKQYHLYNV
jgi:hypothetical protein